VKRYVLGADVAREMRSAAARGEVADLVRTMKGYIYYVSFLGLVVATTMARDMPLRHSEPWFAPL
jgi:hypothetical protein